MEKIEKESMKNVSGGQIETRKYDGEIWYILYNSEGPHPGEIKLDKARDAGATTEYWAERGKYLKEFVSEDGVTGFITNELGVAQAQQEWFDKLCSHNNGLFSINIVTK